MNLLRLPGARFLSHLAIVFVIWAALMRINDGIDPLMSYYLALAAMYATAMFGMVILVGLSGQVSLGNGALMAIGGYVFALTSLNWQTVPILGWQWNPIWSMIFAGFGGIAVGLLIGWIGARLRGPYLAGLTLGIAVGIPAIATRFPEIFGGETGLMLTVPYPAGGYAPTVESASIDEAPLAEVPLEQAPLDEVPLEQAPLEQAPLDTETAGAGDMLTADNFPSAESSPAAGDMLTADNFPSAESSPSALALPSESALPNDIDPTAAGDALLAGSAFVLERWQASLAVTAACIIGFLALNLVRGRQGRIWRAVRDDEVAAAFLGFPRPVQRFRHLWSAASLPPLPAPYSPRFSVMSGQGLLGSGSPYRYWSVWCSVAELPLVARSSVAYCWSPCPSWYSILPGIAAGRPMSPIMRQTWFTAYWSCWWY